MKITTKQISGIIASNVLLIALVACSSSPAPWTRPDESPWSDKHAATEQAAPADEIVINEPAPVIEAEPMAEPEPEPVMLTEPEPVPVAMPATPEEEIMSMDGSAFAVQVAALNDIASVRRYQTRFGLEDLTAVRTDRNGAVVYVLLSLHPDRASANKAAAELELKTGSKPWVRSVAGLQKIVAQ